MRHKWLVVLVAGVLALGASRIGLTRAGLSDESMILGNQFESTTPNVSPELRAEYALDAGELRMRFDHMSGGDEVSCQIDYYRDGDVLEQIVGKRTLMNDEMVWLEALGTCSNGVCVPHAVTSQIWIACRLMMGGWTMGDIQQVLE